MATQPDLTNKKAYDKAVKQAKSQHEVTRLKRLRDQQIKNAPIKKQQAYQQQMDAIRGKVDSNFINKNNQIANSLGGTAGLNQGLYNSQESQNLGMGNTVDLAQKAAGITNLLKDNTVVPSTIASTKTPTTNLVASGAGTGFNLNDSITPLKDVETLTPANANTVTTTNNTYSGGAGGKSGIDNLTTDPMAGMSMAEQGAYLRDAHIKPAAAGMVGSQTPDIMPTINQLNGEAVSHLNPWDTQDFSAEEMDNIANGLQLDGSGGPEGWSFKDSSINPSNWTAAGVNAGIGAVTGIGNLLQGRKTHKLAKDMFRTNKDIAYKNLANMEKDYNTQLEHSAAGRYGESSQKYNKYLGERGYKKEQTA